MDSAEGSAEQLFHEAYEELRRLAERQFAVADPQLTLQPTALVHEAWLRLSSPRGQSWESREHFLAVAARAMRQIVVSAARKRMTQKRGSGWDRVTLSEIPSSEGLSLEEVVVLDDALEELVRQDPRQSRVVELRFFGGMTVREIAAALDMTPSAVETEWRMARAWLIRRLKLGE